MKKLLSALLTLSFTVSLLAGCSGTGKDPSVPEETYAVTLYVSPSGSDSGDGTKENPYATLQAAKEALKVSRPESAAVVLGGGTYFLGSPIVFDAEDCPNVTYKAADGEKPVFTSGISLRGKWDGTAELNGSTVWVKKIDVLPSNGSFNTLYGDSGFLSNSRYPKAGSYLTTKGGADPLYPDWTDYQHEATVLSVTEEIPDLSGEDLSHAYLYLYQDWIEDVCKVESYDAGEGRFHCSTPCTRTLKKGLQYVLENVRIGLDEPGEWFFDYAASTLYYLPKAGETQEETELVYPTNDTFLTVDGQHDIRFRGLTFTDSAWTHEVLGLQAADGSSAAVTVTNSSGIDFLGCDFSRLGLTALLYGDGTACRNCTVESCSFVDIGVSAVMVAGPNNAEATCDGITVRDCYICRYGQTRRYAVGLILTYGKNSDFSHNEVCYGQYTGISVGWSWNMDPYANSNNHVRDNVVYHIGYTTLYDMGGIYLLGLQPDSTVEGNVVFDITSGELALSHNGFGIYLDEGSTGISVFNNLIYDCASTAFTQHYGKENQVFNNIFSFSDQGLINCFASEPDYVQFYLKRNLLVGRSQIMYVAMPDNCFTDEENLYYDYDREEKVVSGRAFDNLDSGLNHDVFSVECSGYYNDGRFADPDFTDPENRNFTFTKTISSGRVNYEPVDYSQVGSQTRASALLLNTFRSPLDSYPESLVRAYREAREAFVSDRNDATIAALTAARNALTACDSENP